ncbi:30S ribosomal protein S4 [Chloroflexota bacterium]
MARYIDAKCRLCRRASDKLMLKGDRCSTAKCAVERRNTVPGQHGTAKRRPKMSDRGLQLREKQKARYVYGIMERQFRKAFQEAVRLTGITGDNLVALLERRLDNIVYRLGFSDSRAQARQLVRHGHIMVNGHKTNIPSFLVESGDEISWREGSTKNEYYKVVAEIIQDKVISPWLQLDTKKMTGKVLALPKREDVEVKFSGKDIVEYYSR